MNDAGGTTGGDDGPLLREDVQALGRRVAELERQLAALQAARPEVAQLRSGTMPPPPLISPGTQAGPPFTEAPATAEAVASLSGQATAGAVSPPARGAAAISGAPVPGTTRSRSDLENRIGSQIFNRVGIVALLLAAAWFLKLAIASGWIGPMGRVLVGLAAGVALVLWSERFRRKGFAIFSYSLKAIGSGVLYLALWAAFQLYHLLPASVALVAMLLVTAWNGWMAWTQNAELLGGYALAGAVATPQLLSTGGDHEAFLFTYLLAVDLLCVLLVRLKGWVRLLPWVFLSTVGYFVGWYASYYKPEALLTTAVFALLLFAAFQIPVFVSTPVAEQDVARPSRALDWRSVTSVLLPFANAAFLSLALYSALEDAHHHSWLAWLMVALAALYLALMRLPQPAITIGVHLSLAIVFLTVAIPLKATGEWITVAWLVEGVALLAVALRRFDPEAVGQATRLLRALASAALLLGWIGAFGRVLFWNYAGQNAFWNGRFGTALAGLVTLAITTLLCRRDGREIAATAWPHPRWIAAAAVVGFNVLAIAAGVREISAVWSRNPVGDPDEVFKRSLAISAFLMTYGAALLAVGFWRRSAFLRWQGLLLVALTIVKIFVWDTRNLGQGYRIVSFLGLGVLLMGISFVYQRDLLSLRSRNDAGARPADTREDTA